METRYITEHDVEGQPITLRVSRFGDPGAGGETNCYLVAAIPAGEGFGQVLQFQDAPISHVGVNGLTNEVLIAIVLDRLRCFQAGPYASQDNVLAIEHLEAGLETLKNRSDRQIGDSDGS
jgi:hypothetical protein